VVPSEGIWRPNDETFKHQSKRHSSGQQQQQQQQINTTTDPVELLSMVLSAIDHANMDGKEEKESEEEEHDMFESLYYLYRKADNRLKEQTLNWKKLVVALEGLRAHSDTIKENENAWESIKGLAEEVVAAGRKYGELRKEVDNYISYLLENGFSPLVPERRT